MQDSRRRAVLAGIAMLACIVAGCAIEATFRGRLEVWNRTQARITVAGRDATFDVAPCGHAVADRFVLNRYDILDDQGRFIALHGGGGSDPTDVAPQYEMVTRAGAVYWGPEPPAEPLPPCDGVVVGQEGSEAR